MVPRGERRSATSGHAQANTQINRGKIYSAPRWSGVMERGGGEVEGGSANGVNTGRIATAGHKS